MKHSIPASPLFFPLIACCLLLFTSCSGPKDYEKIFSDPQIYSNAVHELNNVVMGNNFSPIVASRNYMYAAVAGYEVIAAGHPDQYNSLAGQLHGLTALPRPDTTRKINYGLAALLAYCKLGEAVTFPEGSMRPYVDSLKKMALDHGMPSDVYHNSIAYADTVAAGIMKWSRKDNYLQTRGAPEYMVKDSPGRWIPTPPAYTSAMEPHWREIRSLVLDSVRQFMPLPPYPFNVTDPNSPYYKEVKKIEITVDSLTPEQAFIADFWDDNPFKLNVSGHLMYGTKKFSPGGHWMSIAGIAARKSGADLPMTIYGYAKTAIAMFDAFIQCWNIKYTYTTMRPETVIDRYFDPNWRPHLQTPPFPEYTCGHCTISAAAAQSLTSVYGDNFSYSDTTELEFGIPARNYKSFDAASVENEYARYYGGIHFFYCCERSHEMGKKVGGLVVERLKMKK